MENPGDIKQYFAKAFELFKNSEPSTVEMNVLIDVMKSGTIPAGRSVDIRTDNNNLQYLVGETRLELNQNPYLLVVLSSLQP